MLIRNRLNDDLKAAMRAKDEHRMNAIRMLKAVISNLEIARASSRRDDAEELISEADFLGVVEKQIKQRRESIEMYKQGNRPEFVAKEEAEVAVLEGYLPRQMKRDEIKLEVQTIIDQLGTREFPAVMRQAVAQLKGRAEGRLIKEVVEEMTRLTMSY